MGSMTALYAIVPVRDRTKATRWFEIFFGRPADEIIGEELLWCVSETAWVVIDDRPVRAGSHAQLTLGVAGLDDILTRLTANDIPYELETYGNGVRHVDVTDPDGNKLSLAEAPAEWTEKFAQPESQ